MNNPTESSARFRTLRDVIDHVSASQTLAPKRRGEIASAVRRVCRALGADPVDVVADPAELRTRLDKITPAAVGLSVSRWQNVRSQTIAALRECGFPIMPSKRKGTPFSPEWEGLWSALPKGPRLRHGLSRFIGYCSAQGIHPEAVNSEVLATFHQDLLANSMVREIQTVYRTASVCWNDASRTVPGWPQVEVDVPSVRKRVSLFWEDFPQSYRDDVEAFLNRAENPDVFADDYFKPLSPSPSEGAARACC